MTPAELRIYADAYIEQLHTDKEVAQVRTFNLAALIRAMVWAKHPPRYEQVFPEDPQTRKPMTDEEMYAQVRALNALLGGKEA